MRGAHSSLNVHGAWASVINPTTRMSTPMSRIQSGIASQTNPSGRPDENCCRTTNAVRLERIAMTRLASAPPGLLEEFITLTIILLLGTSGCVQHPYEWLDFALSWWQLPEQRKRGRPGSASTGAGGSRGDWGPLGSSAARSAVRSRFDERTD